MPEVSVWAPNASRVRLWLNPDGQDLTLEMAADRDGWWRIDAPGADPGVDYGFLLDDEDTVLPDPRSRRQPDGVHGPSRFYADDFSWSDSSWAGRELRGALLYELHIGTFTPDGTLDAAVDRLDHLVDLGITHVELLPVNDFNGVWNWGYDGVLWYAVHEAYGGPDALKRFVDACHTRGLAVTLDVVYNHLGPSGNYLPRYGPYFKPGRNTWGDLVNLDGESSRPVREYILGNALMWLAEFHVDALRLDAVHALQDSSPEHLLAELSGRVEALSARSGRPLTLIAESDLNDPIIFTAREEGGYGLDGQWDDDVHHCLHALLSAERQGYYEDFGSLAALAKVFTRGFFHDGTYSTFRGRNHGKPVDREHTPGYRFVACLQNHDQVGNRAAGDRLPEITSAGLLRVGAVLLLTSPFTPMLWMGEEWAASTRWPFFTSHPEPELAEATGKGRVEEFAEHGWDISQIIDPQDPKAFTSAHLAWDELAEPEHASMLSLYRDLLRLRKDEPELSDPRLDAVLVDFDEDAQWLVIHRGALRVIANLADQPQVVPVAASKLLFRTVDGVQLGPDQLLLPAQSAGIVRIG
ncbi:MAG: maltooligosyltrehalose trehalohydrolase [Pseudonocardiales bacterium]|nr:maltooligosyltrehalose trehalohydrolase [Pseudonocardiales bacterium]